MGFSVSAAGAILLIGLLFYASMMTQALLSTQQDMQRALLRAEDRLQATREGALAIDTVEFSASSNLVYVNATNTGSITFNLEDLDLLLDGVIETGSVLAKRVEGTEANVWPAATQLVVEVDRGSAPGSAVLVMPTGAKAFWRA